MKRFALAALLMLTHLPFGHAQGPVKNLYIGLTASYTTDFSGFGQEVLPGVPPGLLPGVQVGGPLSDSLEVRGTFESLLLAGTLGVDVLYPFELATPDARLYAGGGLSISYALIYLNYPDVRGVFGGEYFLASAALKQSVGLFFEVRPYLRGLFSGFPTLEARAGLNFPL